MEQPQNQPDSTSETPEGTSLVVIAREERTVRTTVAFLNRRGIPTKIVTNMNDAVELFSKKQANMALLSVNFPHPKIEMIPTLLNQSFKVDCIVFAEDSDRKTTQKLSNTKARHVLFGPVSGPVVLMRVRQIEKENQQSDQPAGSTEAGENGAEKSTDDESGAIKVGGGKGDSGDRIQVKSKRADKSDADAVAALLKTTDEGSDATDASVSRETLERSGSMIIQKGQRSSMKSATASGPLDKARRGELAARAFGRSIDRGLIETPANAKKKLFIPPPPWTTPEKEAEIEAREEAELQAEVEAAEAEKAKAEFEKAQRQAEERANEKREREREKQERERERAEQRKAEKEAESLARDVGAGAKTESQRAGVGAISGESSSGGEGDSTKESAGSETANASSPEPKAAPKASTATERTTTSSPRLEPVKLRAAKSPEESLFLKAMNEALGTVCGQPIGVRKGVTKLRAAGLVSVNHPKVKGAFVIEVGRSRLNPLDFVQRIEVAFFSILRRTGVDLSDGNQFAIELEDFDIVAKAVDASDYMLISVTPDHEVALAVIPFSNAIPKLEPHKDNMLKLDLKDVPVETPLTFEVFIHLPANDRYLRYLKVGSKMSSKQSDKLGKRYRIGHLYLNEGDRDAYRKHYAAQSIDPSKKGDKSA